MAGHLGSVRNVSTQQHVIVYLLMLLACSFVIQYSGGLLHAKIVYNISIAACGGIDNCDGCPALSSTISPRYMIFNIAGDMYVSETDKHRIRKIDTSGTITTLIGSGYSGSSLNATIATSASINQPIGMALNSLGELVFCDSSNHQVSFTFNDVHDAC